MKGAVFPARLRSLPGMAVANQEGLGMRDKGLHACQLELDSSVLISSDLLVETLSEINPLL